MKIYGREFCKIFYIFRRKTVTTCILRSAPPNRIAIAMSHKTIFVLLRDALYKILEKASEGAHLAFGARSDGKGLET